MKYRAKKYRYFLEEAHIDLFGELQDFDAPRGDEPEYEVLAHAERIQEFLEESGADQVKLTLLDGKIILKFTYFEMRYDMRIDLDQEETQLIVVPNESSEPVEIYNGPTDSLFDMLGEHGLSFLN
jgi:hypothetical protein